MTAKEVADWYESQMSEDADPVTTGIGRAMVIYRALRVLAVVEETPPAELDALATAAPCNCGEPFCPSMLLSRIAATANEVM